MNPKQLTVYQCETCKQLYYHQSSAEQCCADKPDKTKCTCGNTKPTYKTTCDRCHMEYIYQTAEKIHINDYDGYIYDDLSEKYFADVEELSEYYYDKECDLKKHGEELEFPKFFHACYEVPYKIDINFAIDNALEDQHEDAERDNLVDLDKLEQFVEEWNAKQTLKSYDYYLTKIIIGIEKGW